MPWESASSRPGVSGAGPPWQQSVPGGRLQCVIVALGRVGGGECGDDWIRDRPSESASRADVLARARAAWERQFAYVRAHSALYARKFAEAGIGGRVALDDLARLPFASKEELRRALEERPPFGSNACVPPERIKRIYQTSGTTGSPSVIALTPADAEAWTEIGAPSYWATGIHPHHAVVSTYGAGPFVAGHTLLRVGSDRRPQHPGRPRRLGAGPVRLPLGACRHLAGHPLVRAVPCQPGGCSEGPPPGHRG